MMSFDLAKYSRPAKNPAGRNSFKRDPAMPIVASSAKLAVADKGEVSRGLTSAQARRRLNEVGPNAVPDTAVNPLRSALNKFWSPVPWMLEAAIVLQICLGEYVEASIIAVLLVFNAALGFFQEERAQATVTALKSRLALHASVCRDGAWKKVLARELVPGDLIKLFLGSVVAADVRIVEGAIQLDQSMLTGESLPVEADPGLQTYAGALVQRGEATAEVTATGPRTKFGQSAELIRNAHVVSSQQRAVLRVVRNLALFNGVLIILIVLYAWFHAMPVKEIVLLGLTAVLASIPVALPAMFTLAAALGAQALGLKGVLPTRLSAVDEAASMDVLCTDKTGTLTLNGLTVAAIYPMPRINESDVLAMAALASSDGGQDSVDAAIRTASLSKKSVSLLRFVKYVPFDPATKMSEATATNEDGATLRIVKGAFSAVLALAQASPTASKAADDLEAKGLRVLAVAVGTTTVMKLIGLIALSDPPRPDSASLVAELHQLGVRMVMVTGDAPATAAMVAKSVGLVGQLCPPGPIPDTARPEDFAVFAGVLPEDKYHLVQLFQKAGHTVGMCGDGANDAPALRQAQMGIAVSTATDVAKSAAGMVLTKPGLVGIVAAVKEGRITFQRILTYIINSVRSKIAQVLFLVAGLFITGHAIMTPMLMVIVMLTGDFLGMSLATDNVQASSAPNVWRIGNVTIAGIVIGLCELIFCVVVLMIGKVEMKFGMPALQTLAFVSLVFGNQAAIYVIRSRRRLWSSPHPSRWLIYSSFADVLIGSTLAICGILMMPLPLSAVALTLLGAVGFALFADVIKVPVFHRFQITQ
jgi:H+-transporting ATPase